MSTKTRKSIWQRLLIADFYLAALLLLIAGVLKSMRPGVSELLESLLEQGILSLSLILTLSIYLIVSFVLSLFALLELE